MRILFLIVSLTMTLSGFSQSQKGIVKTCGRMVNGVYQAGQGLPGATVYIVGRNALTSSESGRFSFPLQGKSFILKSVKKNDYELVDMDICRSHDYTSGDFYITMEKPDLQTSYQRKKERELRQQLKDKLDQREDEITALNVELDKKNKLLEEVDQKRDNSEKTVRMLSQYYVTLDYDQLDDFRRQVASLIDEGRLEEAEALLRTKGDMESRIKILHEKKKAVANEKAIQAQRQKDIDNTEKGIKREEKDLVDDCMDQYRLCLLNHQNDSAFSSLQELVSIDTTNVDWLNRAGDFLCEYLADYPLALNYYEKALNFAISQYGQEDERIATCYNNIGVVCYYQGNYNRALQYEDNAISIKEQIVGHYHPDVASYLNNIGNVYHDLQKYDPALKNHQEALSIRLQVYGEDHPEVASSYNNIGSVYRDWKDFDKALRYYKQSMMIRENVLGGDNPATATCYNNIGLTYQRKGDKKQAIVYYEKALNVWEVVYSKEHPLVGTACNNLGTLFYQENDYNTALEYLIRSMTIREKKLGTTHLTTAKTYNNVAAVYQKLGDNTHAEEYYQKALNIYEQIIGTDSDEAKKLREKIKAVHI